ncbi:MAG: GNAT family N-acetyltransferase [Pseudomonadota bacterium]
MGDLQMRRARRDDVAAIVRLLFDDELGRTREVLSDPPDAAYLAAFDAIEGDANQLLAVAAWRGVADIVGCLQVTFIPGLSHRGLWRGQIESVRVASTARGTGLGREMIAWAIEQCRQRDCGMVQLTSTASRTDARRFYETLGFEATHVGFKLDLRRS